VEEVGVGVEGAGGGWLGGGEGGGGGGGRAVGGGPAGGLVGVRPAIGEAAGSIEQPVIGRDASAWPNCADPAVIVLEGERVEGIRAESAEARALRHVALDAENNRAGLIIVAELRAADEAIGRVAGERRRQHQRFVVRKRVETAVGARPIVRGSLGGRQSLKDRFDRKSSRGKRGQSDASKEQSLHRHTLCWPDHRPGRTQIPRVNYAYGTPVSQALPHKC